MSKQRIGHGHITSWWYLFRDKFRRSLALEEIFLFGVSRSSISLSRILVLRKEQRVLHNIIRSTQFWMFVWKLCILFTFIFVKNLNYSYLKNKLKLFLCKYYCFVIYIINYLLIRSTLYFISLYFHRSSRWYSRSKWLHRWNPFCIRVNKIKKINLQNASFM